MSVPERPTSGARPKSSIDSTKTFVVGHRRETASQSPVQQNTARAERSPRSFGHTSPTPIGNILSFPTTGSKRRRTDDSVSVSDIQHHGQVIPAPQELHISYSPTSNYINPYYVNNFASPTEVNETKRIEAEYARIADKDAGAIPAEPLLSASSWKKSFRWPNQFTTQQCMCLLKYYIEVLGPWVRLDLAFLSRLVTNLASSILETPSDILRRSFPIVQEGHRLC